MKKVVHYKRTPLALAPDILASAINKYSDWSCSLVTDPAYLPNDGSLVHFHNQFAPYAGPKLIQYHSEPENQGCMPPDRFANDPNLPSYRLVIAQYHATLSAYDGCHVVRNLIDYRDPIYNTVLLENHRIGYSPSTKFRINQWFDKGYDQTKKILDDIHEEFGVEVDIITGVPLQECLRRKSLCSVIIDECVTGSYHRSGLEGLALGKLTICNLSHRLKMLIKKITGASCPFLVSSIENLKSVLQAAMRRPLEEVLLEGLYSREWMELNWRPEDIVQEYIRHYEECLSAS